MKKILLLLPLLLFIGWCNVPHTWEWTWFYYPNWAKNIWDEWVKIQWNLETEEDCDKRAYKIHKNSNNETYDYDCWFKCRYQVENDFYICKEFK